MNEYLWEFAQNMPSENLFQVILKSALSMTASQQADVGKTNNKWLCRKCKTLWMHGCFHVHELGGSKKVDKMLERKSYQQPLTAKQQEYYEYLRSRKGPSLKYTCTLCSHKTRVILDRAKPIIPASVASKKDATPIVSVSKKVKRKRTYDPTAGLTIPAAKNSPTTASKIKPSPFSSKQPTQLHALANMLKQKIEGSSSTHSNPTDRLKLLLK